MHRPPSWGQCSADGGEAAGAAERDAGGRRRGGLRLRGRLPRQLEDAIYDAKAPDGGVPDKDGPNVLVGPVASNFGLHLILVQSCQEPKSETATLPDWMGGGKWERKKNPDAQD